MVNEGKELCARPLNRRPRARALLGIMAHCFKKGPLPCTSVSHRVQALPSPSRRLISCSEWRKELRRNKPDQALLIVLRPTKETYLKLIMMS